MLSYWRVPADLLGKLKNTAFDRASKLSSQQTSVAAVLVTTTAAEKRVVVVLEWNIIRCSDILDGRETNRSKLPCCR